MRNKNYLEYKSFHFLAKIGIVFPLGFITAKFSLILDLYEEVALSTALLKADLGLLARTVLVCPSASFTLNFNIINNILNLKFINIMEFTNN
jgi:hypothetical protein